MIGIVVRFDVVDEEAAVEFDRLTAAVVERIRAHEPGTLVYVTHQVRDEELARVFYEIYADDAALQSHEDAAHVRQFHATKESLLARPPRVEFVVPGPGKGAAVVPAAE